MIGALFVMCILVLSQAPTLARFADASGLATCFWRLLFAAVLISPIALARSRRAGVRELTARDVRQLLLSGFFLFAHLYFFFRAVQETSIATAMVLYSVSPVTTAIGAYLLFREKVTLHLVVSCLLGIAGVAVLFGESILIGNGGTGSGNGGGSGLVAGGLWGDLWAILAAVFFSCYVLTGKHVRLKLANSLFAFAIYAQAAVYAMVAMLIFQVPFTGYTNRTWLAFAAMAVLPTLLGHAIFTYCLNFLNVNFMSCMTLVEPPLSAGAAALLFGEHLTKWAALGFALTAASVLALSLESLRAYARRRGQPRATATTAPTTGGD